MMRRRTGFTLIELLVVIAIIAILAAILFPVFAKARAKSWETACLSNMKQIALGVLMYTQDHDGFYPMMVYEAIGGLGTGATDNLNKYMYWPYAVDPYIKGGIDNRISISWTHPKGVWRCPAMRGNEAWYGGAYSHYAINRYISAFEVLKKDSQVTYPAQTMLFTEGFYQTADMKAQGKHYGWYMSWGFNNGSSYTRYDHNDRANVAFCDGHAKNGTEGQWRNGEWRVAP